MVLIFQKKCTKMTDKEMLFKQLEKFLEEKVPAGEGGDYMAKPTDENIKDLYEIFHGIVDLKFEEDCDGDSPIKVNITDYNKYVPLCYSYSPIPQFGGTHGDERRKVLKEAIKNLAHNTSNASDMLGRFLGMLDNMDKRGE